MNPRADSSAERLASEAGGRYRTLVSGARSQTEQVAGRVVDGKKPVQALSKLGLELSSLSHRTTSKVLKNQTRLIEHQIDALAGRLHTAARAGSIRDLVRSQIRLIPQDASRFVEATSKTLSVVADAGGEVRQLFAGTVAELRGKPQGKTTKPAARKKAKTATRKAAKKKTAKKTARRKASASPRKATAKKSATPPTAAKRSTGKAPASKPDGTPGVS